jgi:hypothetical protein
MALEEFSWALLHYGGLGCGIWHHGRVPSSAVAESPGTELWVWHPRVKIDPSAEAVGHCLALGFRYVAQASASFRKGVTVSWSAHG